MMLCYEWLANSWLSWPLKYSGLALGGNPRAARFWNPVIKKMKKRFQSWKKVFLSKGRRFTLTQAVLGSLPTYCISLFKIPSEVAGFVRKFPLDLGRTRKTTQSGGIQCLKTKIRQAWEQVIQRPKTRLLLGKWQWRIQTENESLWRTGSPWFYVSQIT